MSFPECLDYDELEEAMRESLFGEQSCGFCEECGYRQFCIEPDAENYVCEECGARAVTGVELLFIKYGD